MAELSPHWVSDRIFTAVKPAGLPVFPPHSDPKGDCVLHRLQNHFQPPAEGWPEGFAGGIAHRLDIPTSGQLLVAHSIEDLGWLRELFSSRSLLKRYRFLTSRVVPWSEHKVERPIAHDRRNRRRMVIQRGAQTPHRGKWLPAVTEFRYLGATDGALHLWEARMRTGVMHQIRLHAASVGLALAGDRLYGGGEWIFERPEGAHFALHHLGVEGPGLTPEAIPVPAWWPQTLR
jgi:23S rRNA-/tRNA-specific pseudouridylate synthase